MLLSYTTPIWLYPKPIDFRKQIDGIVILIADHLQLNPVSGQLFLFRNRHANKIKFYGGKAMASGYVTNASKREN